MSLLHELLSTNQAPKAQPRNDYEGLLIIFFPRQEESSFWRAGIIHPLMLCILFSPWPQPVMVITGDPIAAAGASARTRLYATPSPGLATVLQASGAGAAKSAVSRAPMVMTATRDANARMEPPVTMSQASAAAHLDTLEPCKWCAGSRWDSPNTTIAVLCFCLYCHLQSGHW